LIDAGAELFGLRLLVRDTGSFWTSSRSPGLTLAVTDLPPEEVLADLLGLRPALDDNLPAKALDRNLPIATWNIRCLR